MIVNFQLSQKDFLRYQLFTVSQSKQLKKYRLRKRIAFPVVFGLFGLLFLFVPMPISISFICWGVALVWFIIYPVWDKMRYKKRFVEFVNKNYASRFGKQVSIEIKENIITGNDNGFEIVVKPGELEEIIVIPELILIKIDDERVMLVANQKIEHPELFEDELKKIADKWKIPFKSEKNWKW